MGDSIKFTATARSLGIFSAAATVILLVAYAVTLAVGLSSLESPQQPIGDPMFWGSRLAAWIRVLMVASGVLALAGLSGAVVGDMQLRNIGIVGYVGVFLVVAGLVAVLFFRARP